MIPGETVQLTSTITCPHCGHRQSEQMPTDACVYFYECKGCRALLSPQPGDCCVYCSYADTVCPPKQDGATTCACQERS